MLCRNNVVFCDTLCLFFFTVIKTTYGKKKKSENQCQPVRAKNLSFRCYKERSKI